MNELPPQPTPQQSYGQQDSQQSHHHNMNRKYPQQSHQIHRKLLTDRHRNNNNNNKYHHNSNINNIVALLTKSIFNKLQHKTINNQDNMLLGLSIQINNNMYHLKQLLFSNTLINNRQQITNIALHILCLRHHNNKYISNNNNNTKPHIQAMVIILNVMLQRSRWKVPKLLVHPNKN